MSTDERLRPIRPDDAVPLQRLIGDIYAEYSAVSLDLDNVDADLVDYAAYLEDHDGRGWVVEGDDGRVTASGAWIPTDAATAELKRVYVHASARRQGLARALVAAICRDAIGRGHSTLVAWSDAEFVDAHAMYEHFGMTRLAEARTLPHPPSGGTFSEYGFVAPLDEVLATVSGGSTPSS